ncbi:MAG TPA: TlpA disulfide reductase family protein [Nitrolancea sp.]|nr:TlpA disulfide reductase family protein [Nitrolancea sp.]
MMSSSLVTLRRRSRAIFALIVIALLLLSACSGFGGKKLPKATDFNIGSYTTANVLPDGESSFSHVLALKKPIVLNFWGGDCPPCRQEMPDFQKVADQYQGQVIFLGVDVGPFVQLGTHEQAKQLLKDLNITYPTGYSIDDTPIRAYNLPGLPVTLLIDKEGRIVKTKPGLYAESDLKSDIKTLVTD